MFCLNYDRDKFAVNRYVDRTFWADTSDELGVDWREVQSRTDVEAENTSEIPEFLIDSGRTSMSSFAMTSPRLFAEYAERLGIEPEVLLRRDRGDRLLQTIAETDEGNIRLSPGDFKLAEDMLLDQVAIVDEMLDTATGKNIYSKIVERFGNSGESIFDLMRDRAWIKSRTNTLDSDGTYLQEWEITDALNGLEKAMTIRDEADKSLAKLYNSEKKEPDTYSAIVDKFGAMFEEGFRTVDELASDFPNEAMAYLQRIRELDLKNGGKGSLTQNQQDLMFAARDELDARKEANRLQREGRITRAEEQVTNAKDGDTVRITDADLELLENRLHSDIGAAFDMRDAKSLPEMALAIAELEKVFGRTMNELVDIINNTDSLSFVTGEQKLIKLFEDSETQGYTPEDFERFREVIDEFIETDARANQAKEVIEKIERITIDNTASSNIRPLRSKVTSGLSEDDRLMLEALQASMKQGDLTGPQEQLLRELGDKVMAAENPAVKPTKTKSKNDQWHLRLAEQDQAFQEDLMGAEGIYYGHLNGDIRDSTMAELVDNNGVHTLKSGGRAGESTDVLGLFRAMKDKSLSKEERQGKKRLFLAWVKNAKSSYVSQQISVKKVSEENKTSVALQEQTRLANRESTERPTPGVWVGQIKEKDQDGDSVYGMWEGLRNAARQSSDEETALDIERGLAMIDLLGEFGDELYSAGLISSTPAKRLTDFVASSVDFAGKSNKQIADIRKVYSPTFWVGDKLTGKKSTPEGRELLERIRTAAVERGFGAGGNLGSFTVAVHVRQPATVLEKMYAASADMSKRGILPAAEEAAPVTKPVKAADTGITKASDDANSTGEVGKIAPGSNIDKEGLVKIAEAASDYNEFSRLVRAKYGDKAVDGEHFDIVDDYYDRLNPEVVEAKDTIAEILNIRLYHGGTWDGKTKMRAFTHFGTERSAASDRINEKGPMGEYAGDAELTISELDLREDAVILSFRDNGEPHETPTGVIEATINAVLNHLAKSRGDTYGIKLEISRLHARAEYIRTEMFNTVSELSRAGDPEAESLMRMVQSAQQEIMDEYAALLTREGIDGFRYWNSSEGDAPNWSMMMVNDRALVKPEEGAVPRLAEQKPPSQIDRGPNRPDLATVPKKEARADVEATLSRGDSKPMAEKSDVEAVEALEDMPPVEAENAIVNMDGEQAKRVAAEAEAKQAELAKAKADAAASLRAWTSGSSVEAEAKQAELAKAKADAESLSDQQLTKKAEAALYDMSVEEFDRAFDDWPGGTEAFDGFDGDLKAYVKAYDQRLWKAIKNVESLRMQINRGELNPENVTPEQLRTLKNDMAVMSTGDSYADTEMFMMDVDFTFMGKPLTANVDFTNAGYRILGYLDGSHKNSGLGPVSDAPYNGPRVEPNDNSTAKLAYLDLTEKMKDSVIQVVLYRGVASETLSESGGAVLRDGDFEPTGPGFFSSQFGLNVETHSAETGNFMANRPMDADMHAGDGVVVPMFVDIRKPFFAYKHAYPGYTNAELRAMGYDAIIFSSDGSSGFDMMRAGSYTELNYIGDLDKVYSAVSGLSFGKNRAPVSVEIEPTTKAMADVEAGDTLPPSKTKFDIEVDRWRNGTPALHGGSWDGITTMRDWTHFSVDRATAEDRINQKGIDGEYPEDAELQVVERFLKPKTRLLSIVDNGEPHDTPESLIDATRSVVYEFLHGSQMEESVELRATSPETFSNETDKLYARAEKLREEVRDKTITSEQLYAAQKKIMAEYAAMMRRDDIHGFTYTNISEGDKGNMSFMLVDQSRLQPKRDAAAAAKEVEATQARANKLREEYAAMTDEQWKDGPGSRDPDADGVSEPERKAWFDKYFEIDTREQELKYGSKEEGELDYDDPDLTFQEVENHAVDILFPGVADFLNRIHSGDITPQNVTLQEIQTLRHFMRLSRADIMYDVTRDISQSDYGFFGDNKGMPGEVDFSNLLNKIGSYLQGFGNPGQLGPVTYRRYSGPRIQASEAEQALINRLGLAETMAYSQVQITMYRGTGSRDASRWRPDVLYDEGFNGGRDNARDGNFFSPDPDVANWYGDNIMPVFLDIQKPFFAGGVHVSMMPTNAELRAHGYDAIILSDGLGNDLMARNGHMEINFIGNHDQVYSAISGQTYGESRRATPTTTTDAPEVRATTQIIEAEKAVKATAEEEALIRELASTELPVEGKLPVEGSGAAVGKSIDLEDMSLKDLRAYVKDNDLNVRAKSAASLRNKIREAEKAEAITKARAGSGEGIPPKDPPKTARGADGEGEEPKPDKKPKETKKGRSLRIKDDILDLILGRKASEKQVTPSHINPKYKGNLLEEYNAEIASGRAANARAEQYVQTQATNMSSSRINTTQGIDMDVAVKNSMNRLDNRMDREFSDADMEGPEGAELARLFGENSDIEELMVNYGRSVGTKVKLTDVMNELGGTRGYSMADFFAQMEEAGMAILETDAKTGKRNLRATEAEADAFKNYIGQLKHLYLQTLGYNVSKFDKNTALSRGLQVAQNLVYSRLGGTFSASVVLTEGPMNLLRTGGLGPAQLLKNGTTLITGIAQIIGGVTARNIPGMSKFMSALGLDVKRMRYIGEDIVMAMENNNSNALSKFGLAEDAEAGNAAIHSVKGRVAAHGRRILAGGGDVTEDDRFLGGLTARVEATTAAAADLTGVASGMSQVISLVKSMAISIGQNVLVRHGDGLIRMGDAMAKIKDPLTRKQLIDLGRTHKVPKQAVILAAEAGLLSDGASTLKIMKHELGINYGRGGSRGRDLDLQELQDAINARRENRTYSEAGGMGLDELQARQAEIDDKAVGQVQNFLLLFAQQGSPELKGSMKFTAGDPLRSFLFAMTSYPMAAYQHLVANGVATKSGAAAYGTLSALVVLEYNNRLLQQMLYGKDEETKKKALDKLQRVYSGDIETEDIVEVLAMYGTMSPAFGAWGKYSKDLIGLPIATAAGVDTSGHFRANPFLGPVGGTISNMYGKAISPLTKMQSDSTAKRERSLSNFISTAIDAGTPLNNATFQTLSSNLTGKRIGDLIGEIAVKGDMAGRAGSPGGSAPNFARGRGSRWYSQRRQPDSLSDTPNFNQVVDTFLPKIPPPVEPQQATQPPASPNPLTAEDLVRSGKGSASSSLADMLQQRKQ